MSLNESIGEDAALEWIGEPGYAVGHGPQLSPGEPAAELDSFGEVVLVGRLRKTAGTTSRAIRGKERFICVSKGVPTMSNFRIASSRISWGMAGSAPGWPSGFKWPRKAGHFKSGILLAHCRPVILMDSTAAGGNLQPEQ